tara:strand:- start:1074 stop:2030 length:957 start_codon:yes stop_codon:yes gene_type:complete
MGYLGNTPGESFISFAKQVFTIVNSQTAYTLDFAVVDENELRLVVNNVVQEPGSGKAYTASGTTLTLSAALTNGTDEMYCVFLGKARETVTVPTITRDKLNLISDGSNPSLIAKGTSGVSEGYIQLNCAENSHGIKLKSPPHSAGQSYTLTFPQSITNNTFLKTDGSGNLSFAAAGGTNTPVFLASKSDSNQSISHNTTTKITFNNEIVDSDNAFASSTFTVPSGEGGTYVFHVCIYVGSSQDYNYLSIRKNGNTTNVINMTHYRNTTSDGSYNISGLVSASAGDTFEVYYAQSKGSAVNVESNSNVGFTFFGGYKLI